MWPTDADSLIAYQRQLATAAPEPYTFDPSTTSIGGCWVCFPRGLVGPGTDHDQAWSAVVIMFGGRVAEQRVISGTAAGSLRARVDGVAAWPADRGGGTRHIESS